MNRTLGPGALAIIGLVSLYLGGTMKGAIGVGLSVVGFMTIVAAIIGGVKKLFTRSKPDKLALDASNPGSIENAVKIQLHCYKGYRAKYPKEEPTQIYIRVLKDRPGYGKEDIKAVLNQAHSPAAHGKFNFQSVVTSMLVQEHMQDFGDIPSDKISEIVDTVERIIPSTI